MSQPHTHILAPSAAHARAPFAAPPALRAAVCARPTRRRAGRKG
ncbi:hypothetical protein [Streptomyces tropicalis]|uniref:Uncharacterized protein n=1 Tax=Streptomyces tropicalis TaxID=3034234 RepID=A0ABT5ZYB0_9ACTN|nr:hypothetical protein [Streptomyces tropicalis]MDF3297379.1 hypothetical protein [Streptomyces tropicalis]